MHLDNVSLNRFYSLFNNSLDLLEKAVAEGETDFAIAFLCNYHQFNFPYLAPSSGLPLRHPSVTEAVNALEDQKLLLETYFWQFLNTLLDEHNPSTGSSSST